VLKLCLLLAAGCGESPSDPQQGGAGRIADMGADPQFLEAEGAAVRYRPPAGRWRVRASSDAPGQWYETYASTTSATRLRVFTFPVRESRDPAVLLSRAVDTFVRSLGTDGFGFRSRRALDIWGARAAEGAFAAVIDGLPMSGQGRLLLTSATTWAFAVGLADDAAAAERDVVRTFVTSLEPSEPILYARAFRSAEDLRKVVAHGGGEEDVLLSDVVAVALVLEAGIGARFPLSTREVIYAALSEDAQAETKTTRAAYRETGAAMQKARGLAADERMRGMRALGQRILPALLQRASAGYPPALKYRNVWMRLRALAVGTKEDGLTVGAAQCLGERSAFLASLAADREVRNDVARTNRVVAALKTRWSTLSVEEKQALRTSGRTWAALRQAWDEATAEHRLGLRRATLVALSAPENRKEIEALGGGRALLTYLRAHATDEDAERYVQAAAVLPRQAVVDLLGTLGQPTPGGWALGW